MSNSTAQLRVLKSKKYHRPLFHNLDQLYHHEDLYLVMFIETGSQPFHLISPSDSWLSRTPMSTGLQHHNCVSTVFYAVQNRAEMLPTFHLQGQLSAEL